MTIWTLQLSISVSLMKCSIGSAVVTLLEMLVHLCGTHSSVLAFCGCSYRFESDARSVWFLEGEGQTSKVRLTSGVGWENIPFEVQWRHRATYTGVKGGEGYRRCQSGLNLLSVDGAGRFCKRGRDARIGCPAWAVAIGSGQGLHFLRGSQFANGLGQLWTIVLYAFSVNR